MCVPVCLSVCARRCVPAPGFVFVPTRHAPFGRLDQTDQASALALSLAARAVWAILIITCAHEKYYCLIEIASALKVVGRRLATQPPEGGTQTELAGHPRREIRRDRALQWAFLPHSIRLESRFFFM